MPEQSFIQVRVDNNLKQDANAIFEAMGIDMPTAIRMFLKRTILERSLPFDIKIPDEPNKLKPTATYYPGSSATVLPQSLYSELVSRIPAGMITRSEDINNYLMKKYNVTRIEFNGTSPLYINDTEVPYWRVVSARGMLYDSLFCSKELQKTRLEADGLTIVPCGAYGRSLKVEHYSNLLFDFEKNDLLKEGGSI